MWGCCKVACTGWRAWFECAHHRPAQRRSSGLSLVHHLLTLHSRRRCAPASVSFSGPAARARAAFRKRPPQSHADAQARCDCGARSGRTARPTAAAPTDLGSEHFCDKTSDLHVPTAGPRLSQSRADWCRVSRLALHYGWTAWFLASAGACAASAPPPSFSPPLPRRDRR